jgi:hypothetical protein
MTGTGERNLGEVAAKRLADLRGEGMLLGSGRSACSTNGRAPG